MRYVVLSAVELAISLTFTSRLLKAGLSSISKRYVTVLPSASTELFQVKAGVLLVVVFAVGGVSKTGAGGRVFAPDDMITWLERTVAPSSGANTLPPAP